MSSDTLDALDTFIDDGWIDEPFELIKSGKEATVYRCASGPRLDQAFLAVKVYRSRNARRFKNDAVYQAGRVITNRRSRLAFAKKTAFGREFQAGSWTESEFQTLKLLHAAGADVPRPITRSTEALLMEYAGDAESPAPMLSGVTLEPAEAQPLFERLLQNVELWLACDRIHADLSPFNVLYWQGRLTVIDFPQAVDPRFNPNAFALLERDIEHICRYFGRYGVQADAARLASNLWRRFERSEL